MAVGFLLISAIAARDVLAQVLEQGDGGRLAAALALWSLTHLLSPVFVWLFSRGSRPGLSYRRALDIHVHRLPARYLPGGVWHTVSRVVDLRATGFSRSQLAVLVALESLVPLFVALSLGGAASMAAQGEPLLACTAALLAFCGVLLLFDVVRRHRLAQGLDLPRTGTLFLLCLSSVAFWILAASSFCLYWTAFPATTAAATPIQISGAYLLSWSAGFMVIFSPQGIGVFEAALASILGGHLPFASLAVLAAGFRLIALSADAIAIGLRALLRWASGGTDAPASGAQG